MKKLMTLLLSLILVLSCITPVTAEEPKSDDIVILYTNDVHTYIDGSLSYDVIKGVKTYLETQYENVLLVDAGDHIQGTAYGSMDKGKSIIDLMNAADYDLATLGNHEFDYGMDGRIRVTDDWSDFPYVSCNFFHETDGERGSNVLDSYKIFDLGSEKLAIIGITTPESFTKSTPAYFQDENGNYIYGISGGIDGTSLYSDVQTAIDDAKADGATKVIALGHLGDDLSSGPWTSESAIANVSGLDAFIDGHSHSTISGKSVKDKDNHDVLLTQTGEYFNAIGMMVIDADTGEISTELLDAEHTIIASATADTAVKAIKDAWINEVDSQLDIKIGSLDVTLDNYDEDGNRLVRTQLTNSGSFAADALYYLFDDMDMDVDVAIMNGGGIRNGALTGDITYKLCKNIHTFGNVACLQTITGGQLLDALEWGARMAPDVEVGGFLHVAGITFDIDASVESTVQIDDKGIWTGPPTDEYRVKNVKIYNKVSGTYEPLVPDAEYNLAGYNYTLRDLGDGFTMFDVAVNVLDYVMEDYMVIANYIQGFEDSTVGAANSPLNAKYPALNIDYSDVNGDGRITIINESDGWDGTTTIGGLTSDIWFTKYGNVYTDCPAEGFVNVLGFTWGDLVTVKFLDRELVLPVVPTYSYVDTGKPAIILEKNTSGLPTGYVAFAINMGNFGETYGLANKHTTADSWYWTSAEGVSYPVNISFELYEKEGYMAEYLLHDLNRTNDRENYSNLTDEAFANFRPINVTGIGLNKLFRTSSPINPALGRNQYADEALKKAGVTVIMNLADSETEAKNYSGFNDSYYSNQKVIYLSLGVDFTSGEFKTGLAKGLKFFAENEGIYAIHCNEGKDRAGFVSALLECLAGASYDEVISDYMVTYENYYGIEKDSDKYNAIANSNIVKTLQKAFDVDNLEEADLEQEASDYIRALGLTDNEITTLKANLSGSDDITETGDNNNSILYFTISLCALMCICGVSFTRKHNHI